MLYCIEVERELEDKAVLHHNFDKTPTKDDILKLLEEKDFHYDDNYGRLNFYEVK